MFVFSNFSTLFNKIIIVSMIDFIKMKIDKNRIGRLTRQEFVHPNIGSLFATKDIYADLARFNPIYGLKLKFVRKIYKYIQPDNNTLLNYITCRHFGIDYKNRVFSNKTMNCLVNKGVSTKQFLKYINKIQKITKNTVPLENIII
jgi:UDP-N-acetylenolpyruvoylglucosamine reductase